MTSIEIPLSKTKLVLMFIGAVAFVAIGFWLLEHRPDPNQSSILQSKPVIYIAGGASILFFGICSVYIGKKIFNKQPGLVIDGEGITDNSSGIAAGLIPWSDMQEIKTANVLNQRFVLIVVAHPQDYIDRQGSWLKRRAMKSNYSMYGTPICLSANGLSCSFDELYRLITENINKNRSIGLAEA